MPTWRIEYDAVDVSVDEDIKKVSAAELAKIEAYTETIKEAIEEGTEGIPGGIVPSSILPAVAKIISTFSDKELTLYGGEMSNVELGTVTVKVVPKGITLPDEVEPTLPFKQGGDKPIPGRNVGYLASERFDIDFDEEERKLKEKSPHMIGSTRFTLLKGDVAIKKMFVGPTVSDTVLKWVLAQKLSEGIEPKYVPKVIEPGLDYDIVETVTIDEERVDKIMAPVKKVLDKAEEEGLPHDERIELFKEAVKDIDKKHGSGLGFLAEKYRDTVHLQDMIKGSSLAFRGEQLVLADTGSLAIGDSELFLQKHFPEITKKYMDAIRRRTDYHRKREDAGLPAKELEEDIIDPQPATLEEQLVTIDKMKNTIAGIMGKGDLAEQIERGEVEPSELSGLPLVYHKKLEQYREALRSKAVLSEIEKVDTEKIATEKSEDIQKHMGLVPSMQDLKDSQEEIMGPVHEGMIEFRDEVEKKFDDDDEETAAIYFTTILSLADARGARFHGEKLEETRKFAMIDIVTAHIVKEVLKKTDFTLEYTVIGNEPGVDYQEEMQTAIKQVADFWLWRIQKIIGGIVLE